jgi:ankyrin repeat protein
MLPLILEDVVKDKRAFFAIAVLVFSSVVFGVEADPNVELVDALVDADYKRAEEALLAGADPNARYDDGYPLLVMCAVSPDPSGVAILLQHGALVEATSPDGNTALIVASKWGHYQTVRTLLEHGAKPGTIDKKGKNAMHYAAIKHHEKVVSLLKTASQVAQNP